MTRNKARHLLAAMPENPKKTPMLSNETGK
jgi:hypothetical protein